MQHEDPSVYEQDYQIQRNEIELSMIFPAWVSQSSG
jgi:hypothetical protein